MNSARSFAIHLESILIWGFAATAMLSMVLELSRGLGMSRMSLPFIVGTMFTKDRHRAQVVGFAVHFVTGWLAAFLYALIFESMGYASWWLGAVIGSLHGLFLLSTILPLLPHLHPRMASEYDGPAPTRMLEPPGFLALNYGHRTPLTSLFAHLIFGLILGAFYKVTG